MMFQALMEILALGLKAVLMPFVVLGEGLQYLHTLPLTGLEWLSGVIPWEAVPYILVPVVSSFFFGVGMKMYGFLKSHIPGLGR